MEHIKTPAFKEALESRTPDVAFIDVRSVDEYTTEHIHGVRNIPLHTLKEYVAELSEKSSIYAHCQGGVRSVAALKQLSDAGVIANLYNLEGGLNAWIKAGETVVRG